MTQKENDMNPQSNVSELLAAEVAALTNQVEAVKQAEAARDKARAAFDVAAIEAEVKKYSGAVAATVGGLGDDVLSDARFEKLRREIARWAGTPDAQAIENAFHAILEEKPTDLSCRRGELERLRACREAACARVDNRKQYLEHLKATIEPLGTEANAAFEAAQKDLDAAFAEIQTPTPAGVAAGSSAALKLMIGAETQRDELRKELKAGEVPLDLPEKGPDGLYPLPEGGKFEVLCFGVLSRGAMEESLMEVFASAVGEYHCAIDELFESEKALADAEKAFAVAAFEAEQREKNKDRRLIATFRKLTRFRLVA